MLVLVLAAAEVVMVVVVVVGQPNVSFGSAHVLYETLLPSACVYFALNARVSEAHSPTIKQMSANASCVKHPQWCAANVRETWLEAVLQLQGSWFWSASFRILPTGAASVLVGRRASVIAAHNA